MGLFLGCNPEHLDLLLSGQAGGAHAGVNSGGLLVDGGNWFGGDRTVREEVFV